MSALDVALPMLLSLEALGLDSSSIDNRSLLLLLPPVLVDLLLVRLVDLLMAGERRVGTKQQRREREPRASSSVARSLALARITSLDLPHSLPFPLPRTRGKVYSC